MKKSQLRHLAAQAADARIPRDEYRNRRRELLDNIVAGIESIDRTQAHPDDGEAPTSLNAAREGTASLERQSPRRVPMPLVLATGLLLGVAALGALLWPEPSPPPVATHIAPSAPKTQRIPRSRELVENFVARRDFEPDSIDDFRRDWQQIDATDRQRALDELWFGSMIRTLRDEITTQKALAGLTSGKTAMERAQLAFALGEFLGVSDKLPRIDDVADPSTEAFADDAASGPETATVVSTGSGRKSVEAPVPPTADATQTLAPTTDAPMDAVPTTAAVPAAAPMDASPAAAPTASQWLVSQADEQLSLPIVAIEGLDGTEAPIASRPEVVAPQILASEGTAPRRRILYGVFAGPGQTTSGSDTRLPARITRATQEAKEVSLPVVRDNVAAPASTPASATAAAANDVFTLQVFATANRNNAQALIDEFPGLKLQMRRIAANATPYRVVYGGYPTAAEARTAALALPKALLARLGTPLPKSTRSLGTASSQGITAR